MKNQNGFKKQFIDITTNDGYWWDLDIKQWTKTPDQQHGYGSHCKCKTERAFRRRLKQWSKYLPKGTNFILVGKYVNQMITGKTL